MRRLIRALLVVLALIFLLEAWLWDHLRPVVGAVVACVPWTTLKRRLTALLDNLSPNATLAIFVLPAILLLPLKILEIWLLAHRYWLSAVFVLIVAKLVGVGVTAFIFDVTRAKVLQIAWFRRLYDYLMWLRDWAHAMVDPMQRRAKQWLRVFSSKQESRAMRLLKRLRRRMQAYGAS